MSEQETCDDMSNDENGCTDNCKGVRDGFVCNGGSTESPTTCEEICGDGLNVGEEICDDNNKIDGDGCSADCKKIEEGWTCESKRTAKES